MRKKMDKFYNTKRVTQFDLQSYFSMKFFQFGFWFLGSSIVFVVKDFYGVYYNGNSHTHTHKNCDKNCKTIHWFYFPLWAQNSLKIPTPIIH